jgi:hypothetical protein
MKIKVYRVIREEKCRKKDGGKTDGPKLRLIVMDVEAFPLKNISSDLGNDERKWFRVEVGGGGWAMRTERSFH